MNIFPRPAHLRWRSPGGGPAAAAEVLNLPPSVPVLSDLAVQHRHPDARCSRGAGGFSTLTLTR